MIASVSGRRMRKVVPSPIRLSSSMLPRRASMLRRTTSMPTPRPDRLVTCSAVEKPGSKTGRIPPRRSVVARHRRFPSRPPWPECAPVQPATVVATSVTMLPDP